MHKPFSIATLKICLFKKSYIFSLTIIFSEPRRNNPNVFNSNVTEPTEIESIGNAHPISSSFVLTVIGFLLNVYSVGMPPKNSLVLLSYFFDNISENAFWVMILLL